MRSPCSIVHPVTWTKSERQECIGVASGRGSAFVSPVQAWSHPGLGHPRACLVDGRPELCWGAHVPAGQLAFGRHQFVLAQHLRQRPTANPNLASSARAPLRSTDIQRNFKTCDVNPIMPLLIVFRACIVRGIEARNPPLRTHCLRPTKSAKMLGTKRAENTQGLTLESERV